MRISLALPCFVQIVALTSACSGEPGQRVGSPLPAAWLTAWKNPPLADRPLQIVHGIDARGALPEGMHQMLHEQGPAAIMAQRMQCYKDLGLGGVVCNVAFHDYLRSEHNWSTLASAVGALSKLGMGVWIYDEQGYPSGAAGGLVLKDNRQFEAQELAFDPSRPDPFVLRPAYEYTHASNNYFAQRRYINLFDDRAVRSFLAVTHDAYGKRLERYFGTTLQAMFTDEPSLIAVNLGQIPEAARKKVPTTDPVDPSVRLLPTVPWCYDLPEQYRSRYGDDLLARRRSLFTGDSAEDRQVRRRFWSLVADLVAERYFGAIQNWCAAHHIASSGHTLREESLIHHVPLEGNALKALGRMDIPGLDLLTSDPEVVASSGWLTAGLPTSAAVLHGRRRVMTEVSDFAQTQSGRGPAGLPEMQATAAWQAAWGVTEFTLYYQLAPRSVAQYRAYCDYVGRLNAILKPARLASKTLLYYPIHDLWPEYVPVAGPLRLDSQSPRAQQIVRSFMRLGQTLQRSQVPAVLIDHEGLAAARVCPGGKLAIEGHEFDSLLLPDAVELPPAAASVAGQFERSGGRVLRGPWDAARLSGPSLVERVRPECQISPASPNIALGAFARDGRSVALVVNVGRQPYTGALSVRAGGDWQILDPADGTQRVAQMQDPRQIRLSLAPCQALLLVSGAK
jgi:hypothetical protein